MSVSNADDVMLTSSSQNKEIHSNHSILPKKDPPEGKTTAVITVHRHHSNKHYKKKIMRILVDSGSDSNLIFVNKDKSMLLPSSKRLVPQMWNTSKRMFQTKRKAGIELNFLKYSNSKRFFAEPDIVKYSENNKPQYDLILVTVTMKELGIIMDFKAKMMTVDEVKLPMQNINYLQGASTVWALKLNHSPAMEPHSTQDDTKCETRILDTKYQKADLQSIVRDNCKHLSADQQKKLLQLLKKYETHGTLGDWKTKLVSFQLREGVSPYHGRAFPVPKNP
jgi:hypothetical protein